MGFGKSELPETAVQNDVDQCPFAKLENQSLKRVHDSLYYAHTTQFKNGDSYPTLLFYR